METKDLSTDSAALYMQATQEKRANTLLISPTRVLRDAINNQIRLELQEEGSLKSAEKPFIALRQKDLNKADSRFVQSYRIGDIFKFNKSYKNNIDKNILDDALQRFQGITIKIN